jgi:branched-chain amino acid transport system substrate-binding protein
MTNAKRLAAVAAATALVLSACGTDDNGDDDDNGAAPAGEPPLRIGALLPQSGSLAFLGPPQFAGVQLALQEINDYGGVLGEDVIFQAGDEGDAANQAALTSSDDLLDWGADVIIGTASSGIASTVMDKIQGNGTVLFSPANTTTSFDEGQYSEPDLYFRTSPSDVLQGAVLANLLVEDDRQNVAIMSRQDAYGETLVDQVTENFQAQGGNIVETIYYSENATSFGAEVNQAAASGADALVLIAFDETATILPELVQANFGPSDVPTYFVDGNTADYSADSDTPLPPGTLEGVKGTIPGAEAPGEFRERLLEIDPNLNSWSYAGEAYDATIVAALAAIAANSTNGADIAKHIVDITRDGTECTTFAECADLLADGQDIDYNGVSGPIRLGYTGSPTAASIGIYEYGEDNTHEPVDYIFGEI